MGRRLVDDIPPNPGGTGVLVCGSCGARAKRGCRCGRWRPVWGVLPDPRRMRAIDPDSRAADDPV
jgi:hypothetical protein